MCRVVVIVEYLGDEINGNRMFFLLSNIGDFVEVKIFNIKKFWRELDKLIGVIVDVEVNIWLCFECLCNGVNF